MSGSQPRPAMTSTTTIRIEDALKQRVAAAAERAGKSAHGFILDAIVQTVERVELDEAFQRVAEERWAELVASGESVSWDAARAWFEDRSRGEGPLRPPARKPVR